MDTNTADPIIDTKAPDQTSEVKSEDQQKYQQILDEYSQELDKNPAKPNLDTPIPPLPPSLPTPITPPPPQPPKTPKAQPPEPTPLPDQPQSPKKKFNLFKYLFYISALIFLVLVGLLVKDYLTLKQIGTTDQTNSVIQSPVTTVPTIVTSPTATITQTDSVCNLNDIIYRLGDTVPSQDDCNTCACLDEGAGPQIICTEKDCSQITPSL